MITCFLQGGLGNQLFQIFATIAYSFKTQQPFVFTKTDILVSGTSTPRKTYWNDFLSNLSVFTKPWIDNSQFSVIREKGFTYHDIKPGDKNQNHLLYGYFHSYKYFSQEKEKIYRLLHLDAKKQEIKNKYVGDLGDFNYISMHFRIGDYKKLQQCYHLLPLEYYKKSLEYIIANTSVESLPKRVLVFCESGDLEDVLKIVNILMDLFPRLHFELINFMIPDWEQLLLLSFSKHNIIANSTFSWWGAYLNENHDNIVCYPGIWFGPLLIHQDTKDLFPPQWKKIDV